MKQKFVLPVLLSISLFASGCLEEKDTITVYPDGSGVLHIHKRFGEAISGMVTSFGDKNNPQAALDKTLFKDLSHWNGVTAWTGCKVSMDGKCIVTEVTGYFDDLSGLKQVDGKNVQSFSWDKNSDGGFTFVWNSDQLPDQDALDKPPDNPEQFQQVLGMMKGLKIEHEVFLPGTVTASTGRGAHEGRSASTEFTDKDVIKYCAIVDEYRAKVAKGDIPKAQTISETQGKLRELSMNMRVTCGPGGDDDGFAQFRREFEAAKADYASAGTAAKIQDAKKG